EPPPGFGVQSPGGQVDEVVDILLVTCWKRVPEGLGIVGSPAIEQGPHRPIRGVEDSMRWPVTRSRTTIVVKGDTRRCGSQAGRARGADRSCRGRFFPRATGGRSDDANGPDPNQSQ